MVCYTTGVISVLLLSLFPEVDGALSLCASCGDCSSSTLQISGYSAEYFYKTNSYYSCTSCLDAVNGGKMFVYQAYSSIFPLSSEYNVYLWFNCNTGRWTRSTVLSGWSSCPDRFSCTGPYPTSTTFVGAQWDACPYSGSATCSAPSSSTHSHSPHTHSPYTHSPHTHSPSLSHSHSPHTHNPASLSSGGGSQVDHICDIVKSALAAIPECGCTETTGGTGLVTKCLFSNYGFGNVGVRIQLEPCGGPAFAETAYQLGDDSWNPAGRIEAGGKPLRFSVPGASAFNAGLYVSVTVAGNAARLSVHARLSACIKDVCDGDDPYTGSALTAAGFPFSLLEFDDLAFVDSCPEESSPESSSSSIIIIAAAAGCAAAVLLAVGLLWSHFKKKWAKQKRDQVVVPDTTTGTQDLHQ